MKHAMDSAALAASMSWPEWLLDQERSRGRILLGLLVPVSFVYILLDFRLTGMQFWVNVSLRALVLTCMTAALWSLWRDSSARVVFGLLQATLVAYALFFMVRYGQGLGLGGMPGHLPGDLVAILVFFVIPNVITVQAVATACIAVASGIDYIVFKGVAGTDAIILATTLLLTWALGFGVALSRRTELRERYTALKEVYLLRSSIPICAWCKSIRDDSGIWERLETYLEKNADMMLTHGVCPSCMEKVESEGGTAEATSR